ncbi:MAG: ABC transporter ATP-binding protein [Flavobacteriales bacterium]|nr:ABC transporter ATP-binding protein [Flavobacteriales bacterium]
MSKQPLLEVKNLVTEFHTDNGTVRAVDDISFTLHRGETIGIVGESGSGKSVTSLSAMRLIPEPPGKIVNGKILFHGQDYKSDLANLNEKQMRKFRGNEIAMIFQEPMTSLNPVFTCGKQVMEAIQLHQKFSRKEAKEKTIELFKKVKLPRPEEIFSSYPHQISGGQKQRVMIAMALSCNPAILIADEPTTALDVTVQETILHLMKELQEEYNMGILFITHDLGVIAELADEVVVMYKGKLVEKGPALQVFSSPNHPYTRGLLACRPPLDVRVRELPTRKYFMTEDEDGVIVETGKTVSEVIKELAVSKNEVSLRHEIIYAQEPLLEVSNLKTYFPNKKSFFGKAKSWVKAVDDVSFKLYPGETLGLVGESGCGKTTLGRTILKLIEPTDGTIVLNGENITGYSNKSMRRLRKDAQIIFQDPYSSLNPRITIGEAIMEPMRVHKVCDNEMQRKQEVLELLVKVGLDPNQFNRYPHEFSGGQRQRICIARSIALKPKLIICDESVSALDVSVQADVLNLLNELRDEFGLTFLFISHDLSVVKFMSDRMIVMKEGKIEEEGLADEIYANPKTEYTRSLINSIPKGRIEDIRVKQQLKKSNSASTV